MKKGILIAILVCIVLAILVFGVLIKGDCQKEKYNIGFDTKSDIITIKNPIDGKNMLWIQNNFTKNNWPDPKFQQRQKKASLKYILEKGKGVLDIGAHIGDYSIPLALALKNKGREDIMVYAVDPSQDKCDFMKEVVQLNKLNNITIICKGISDKIGKYSVKQNIGQGIKQCGLNTGGWQWTPDENGIEFTTLDHLYKMGKIGDIGFFWLDAQWMEPYVLRGGEQYLTKYKPYILMEYEPATEFENDGVSVKHYSSSVSKDTLRNDPIFKKIFEKYGIKISDKPNDFDDILLTF